MIIFAIKFVLIDTLISRLPYVKCVNVRYRNEIGGECGTYGGQER